MQHRDIVAQPDSMDRIGLRDGALIFVRAIEPRDADRLETYLAELSAESRRNRLLGAVNTVSPAVRESMVRMDGARDLALLAFAGDRDDDPIVAEAMQVLTPGHGFEIALSVADAWQRRGIGTLLLRNMESRACRAGIRCLFGDVLRTNLAMKILAHKEGFSIRSHYTDAKLVQAVKILSCA